MSVFVKICGITSEEDALLAVAMGADALGFVFAPSPRQVSPSIVSDIVKRLPPEILTVGVFRDEAPERVVQIVSRTALIGAQLHGSESPAVVKQVAASVRFVIKGFRAGSPAVREAASFGADCILIDAPNPGSGEVFDWSLAAEIPDGVRIMLAGGLTPENVADAVASVQPWAVDVSSGVEAAPGRKDPVKLRAFIAAAKSVPLAEPMIFEGERPYDWRLDG
jgi:phosphoribosylanthranilate isomerase